MKRHFILASVSMLVAGSAFAQSSVNIYGRLNVTAERIDVNGKKSQVLNNNASRIGFKGIEDLGGGLKAGFVLEHGFNPDTGTPSQSGFWARQSEVNLAGGFGMLRLGNFTSEAYYATSDYIGMHNHETGDSSDAFYAYLGRNVNKIAYRTPEFVGGLTMEAAVSLAERVVVGTVNNKNSIDFAINYGAGPLHLGFGYEKNNTAKQFAASGLYEFGAVTLGAMVQRDTNGYGVGFGNRTNFRLSGMVTAGNVEFHANVGSAGKYSKVSNSAAKQGTLGINYNLSKRTKVYTYYTKIDDGKAAVYGGDFSALAVGVRHNF